MYVYPNKISVTTLRITVDSQVEGISETVVGVSVHILREG